MVSKYILMIYVFDYNENKLDIGRSLYMLGAFSISLNVKDIHKSFEFYKILGFEKYAGDINQKWLIMKQGDTIIGLFQDMIQKNMLTFNPGWDQNASKLDTFVDARILKQTFKDAGIVIQQAVEKAVQGPTHFMIEDPDGNPIFIDQHV